MENSLGEVNVRLTDDERQVAELQAGKAKSQKELEALVSQLEEAESHASTLERQNKAFTLQVQEDALIGGCYFLVIDRSELRVVRNNPN